MGFLSKLFGSESIATHTEEPIEEPENKEFAGVSIVVGDTSVTIQKVIELTFKSAGAEVHLFSKSLPLLEHVSSHRTNALFLDALLKPQDGYDICGQLRQQQQYESVPIFILYSPFQSLNEDRFRNCRATGSFKKPFDSGAIYRAVAEALGLQTGA